MRNMIAEAWSYCLNVYVVPVILSVLYSISESLVQTLNMQNYWQEIMIL